MTPIFKKKKLIELSPDFSIRPTEFPIKNIVVEIYVEKNGKPFKISYVKPKGFTGTLRINFNEGGLAGVFEEDIKKISLDKQ